MSTYQVYLVGKNMLRLLAFAGTCAAIVSTPLYASTLSGEFSGTFSAPTDPSAETFVYAGAGTNTLTWGAPSGEIEEIEEGDSATLSVTGGAFNFSDVSAGQYMLGQITWDNHSNWHAGGKWNSVLSLDLTINTPDGPSVQSIPLSFSLDNTTDMTIDTDFNEMIGVNPDTFSGLKLDVGAFDFPIDLGHGLGLTDIVFGLIDGGTSGTSGTYLPDTEYETFFEGLAWGSIFDPNSGVWQTREGGVATIGIFGTVSAVPLPAGVWLLMSALGGAFMMGRRKQTA